MASFLNILAVTIVSINLLKDVEAQVAAGENAGQFSLLCRIYNVAKHPPINYTDTQDALKIVEQIDAINSSLSGEKWFNEIEKAETSEKLSEAFRSTYPDYQKQWVMWKKAVTRVASGKEYTKVNPTTTREAALAQIRLKQITQKAHKILDKIKTVNVPDEIKKAKAEFSKAIFGDTEKESDGLAKVQGSRTTACGPANLARAGDAAGKNLIVDFLCLCADHGTSTTGAEKVCGVVVGQQSNTLGWHSSVVGTAATMWTEVQTGCAKVTGHRVDSTYEAGALLGEFLNEVGAGGRHKASRAERKPGMLGTSASTGGTITGTNLGCDGAKAASNNNGVCVFYGNENWANQIEWFKRMKNGLELLDNLRNQTDTLQNELAELRRLQHRAEETYEEATSAAEVGDSSRGKHITNQSKQEHPLTSGNKGSFQEPTNISTATIPCLILPWIFLL